MNLSRYGVVIQSISVQPGIWFTLDACPWEPLHAPVSQIKGTKIIYVLACGFVF